MAAIRMTHIEHGYHIAYDGAEVKKLEDAGWRKIKDDEFQAILAAKNAEPEEIEEVEVAAEVAPKKPGRPKKA